MKYFYAALGLFFLTSSTLFGQKLEKPYEHIKGGIYEKGANEYTPNIILTHPEYSFAYSVPTKSIFNASSDPYKMTLTRFNQNMQPLESKALEAQSFGKGAILETCLNLDGVATLMVSKIQSDGSLELWAHRINTETLEVETDGILLGTTVPIKYGTNEIIAIKESGNPKERRHFTFVQSESNEQHAALIRLSDYKAKHDGFQRDIIGFSADLKSIWQNNITTDLPKFNTRIWSANITNEGEVIIGTNVSTGRLASKAKKTKEGAYLISVTEQASKVQQLDIDDPESNFESITAISPDQTIITVLIHESEDEKDGMVEMIINDPKSLTELERKSFEISPDLVKSRKFRHDTFNSINKYYKNQKRRSKGKKVEKSKKVIYANIDLYEMQFSEDGSFYILAVNRARNIKEKQEYFGDMTVFRFNPGKDLDEIFKISYGRSIYSSGFYEGFVFHVFDNRCYLIYTDHVENKNHRNNEEILPSSSGSRVRDICLRMSVYSPETGLKTRKFTQYEDEKLRGFPGGYSLPQNDLLYIPHVGKSKNVRISKLILTKSIATSDDNEDSLKK